MKRIFIIALVLVACNTQSKVEMQAEYDTIVKELNSNNYMIGVVDENIQYAKKDFDNKMLVESTRVGDSLRIVNEKLEKRKKELAERLYKKE